MSSIVGQFFDCVICSQFFSNRIKYLPLHIIIIIIKTLLCSLNRDFQH